MMTEITLDNTNCIDFLEKYWDAGHAKVGPNNFSLRESARLSKVFKCIKDPETEHSKLKDYFTEIFRYLDLFHLNRAYSKGDAETIMLLVDYINTNVVAPKKEPEPVESAKANASTASTTSTSRFQEV